MNDTVAAIVSAFFVIGILVGIVAVIAMSVLRAEQRVDPGDLLDTGPDRHPRWPGASGSDFSDR
jgi:hypothetical protein